MSGEGAPLARLRAWWAGLGPQRRRGHAVVFIALALLALAAAGLLASGPDRGDTLEGLRDENAALRRQLLVMREAGGLDRQAYADVEKSLREYQDEVMELKQEVEFYRGIVTPGGGQSGLRLRSFGVVPNGSPGGYSYTVVLTQVLSDARPVTGTVSFSVQGLQNGAPRELSLRELGQPGGAVKFKFKYFQSVQGDLALPPGFSPLRTVVRVVPGGGDEITATYPWTAGTAGAAPRP